MFAFVVFGLVFSALSQKITWEERLQNDLFCVGWEVKTLNQSVDRVRNSFHENVVPLWPGCFCCNCFVLSAAA